MKKVKNISLILLVLALLIIGSSSIVVTNENEYSLIRQFGKVDHVVSSAGVTFTYYTSYNSKLDIYRYTQLSYYSREKSP